LWLKNIILISPKSEILEEDVPPQG